MKRALVLGGGGARGSFQVGMLKNLVLDRGLDFQIIRGISVGALNAAWLAQASTAGDSLGALRTRVLELEEIWRKDITGNRSVYITRPGGVLALAAGANSLYDIRPLRKLILERLSLEALRTSGRDFKVGTVSLITGRYAEWDPAAPDFIDKILASAAIPCVFPFIRTSDPAPDVLVDGGVRNITPLASAFDAGADEVYVLLTSRLIGADGHMPDSGVMEDAPEQWRDNWLGTKVSGLTVLKRTLEILTDEIYLDDIRGALAWNRVLGFLNRVRTEAENARAVVPESLRTAIDALAGATSKRFVPVHVIAPRQWYGPHNSSTEFDPRLIAAAIEHGYAVASDQSLWLIK